MSMSPITQPPAPPDSAGPPLSAVPRTIRDGSWGWSAPEISRAYGEVLGAYGLAVYLVLTHEVERDGSTIRGLSIARIAQRIRSSQRTVSQSLERLEQLGLIARRPVRGGESTYVLLRLPELPEQDQDVTATHAPQAPLHVVHHCTTRTTAPHAPPHQVHGSSDAGAGVRPEPLHQVQDMSRSGSRSREDMDPSSSSSFPARARGVEADDDDDSVVRSSGEPEAPSADSILAVYRNLTGNEPSSRDAVTARQLLEDGVPLEVVQQGIRLGLERSTRSGVPRINSLGYFYTRSGSGAIRDVLADRFRPAPAPAASRPPVPNPASPPSVGVQAPPPAVDLAELERKRADWSRMRSPECGTPLGECLTLYRLARLPAEWAITDFAPRALDEGFADSQDAWATRVHEFYAEQYA